MRLRTAILTLLAFAAAGVSADGASPDAGLFSPFQARFNLARNSFTVGISDFTLAREADGSYTYKSVSHPTGLASLFAGDLITETSHFQLVDGRPRSLSYSFSQTGGKHEKTESIEFDWEKSIAASDEDDRKRSTKLTPDVCDVFLMQLLVAQDEAGGKLAASYKVLNHRELTDYALSRLPDQKLKLGGITYDTVVLERKDPKKDRVMDLWLSPALHYLPVQVQQSEPGKATFTLSLESISFDSSVPATATK